MRDFWRMNLSVLLLLVAATPAVGSGKDIVFNDWI
jgi:hypothetical protein